MISKGLKHLYLFFPVVFLFELIFGYSGKLLIIHGIPIRHILFVLTFFSLCALMIHWLIKNKVKFFGLKNKDGLIGQFRLLDWGVAVLLSSTAISMLIIPGIYGLSYKMAIIESLVSFLILFLYFPISLFIRAKLINFQKFEKIVLFFVAGLALIHVIFYIGQSYDIRFIEKYFDFIKIVFRGRSVAPVIMLGHGGYTRVIFTTSVFLMVGICILLKRIGELKIYEYVFLALYITAILATITKSIWLGAVFGLFVFCIFYLYVQLRLGNKDKIISLIGTMGGILLLTVVLNFTIFNNMIWFRMSNSFVTTNEILLDQSNKNTDDFYGDKPDLYRLDKEGAIISNDIKIEQTKLLIQKWKDKPIFGYGYGSYLENYIRAENGEVSDYAFSYEMQAPALLMKIGVFGVSCWMFFIISMIITVLKTRKNKYEDLFAWLFLLVAFGISVQTNPFLLSFTGMSIVLYLAISCVYFKDEYEKKVTDGKN